MEIGGVPITVSKFPDLSFVPTGDFGEIPGDPGDPIDLNGLTIRAFFHQASRGLTTGPAGGKFWGKGDLIVLGQFEGFNNKISQGFLMRL